MNNQLYFGRWGYERVLKIKSESYESILLQKKPHTRHQIPNRQSQIYPKLSVFLQWDYRISIYYQLSVARCHWAIAIAITAHLFMFENMYIHNTMGVAHAQLINRIRSDNKFSSQLKTIDGRFQPLMNIIFVVYVLVRTEISCTTVLERVRVSFYWPVSYNVWIHSLSIMPSPRLRTYARPNKKNNNK